ncbi:MAG: hypothetical protein ACRD0L_00855 [Acidimicrobiales bacterium]
MLQPFGDAVVGRLPGGGLLTAPRLLCRGLLTALLLRVQAALGRLDAVGGRSGLLLEHVSRALLPGHPLLVPRRPVLVGRRPLGVHLRPRAGGPQR